MMRAPGGGDRIGPSDGKYILQSPGDAGGRKWQMTFCCTSLYQEGKIQPNLVGTKKNPTKAGHIPVIMFVHLYVRRWGYII